MLKKLQIAVLTSIAGMFCTGCNTLAPSFEGSLESVNALPADQYVRTNEPAVLGRKQFEAGYYGLSERYFREAVEKDERDTDSWTGLAASYDHLKRFELADRAYQEALRLSGPSVPLLNNMGFSYMLRGSLKKARVTYLKALELDPTNEVVINNLKILDGAQKPLRGPRP